MTNRRLHQSHFNIPSWIAILLAMMVTLLAGSVQAATGLVEARPETGTTRGVVLPAQARALGYSLYDMAKATANFNVTDRSGPVPNTPFQLLYISAANPSASFRVMQGQFMYVPIVYNDNSLPIIGDFPTDAEDRTALLNYWFSQAQFGTVQTEISVDGQATELNGDYVAGVSFSTAIADGATQYATTAVFIPPLPPGTHTIEYYFKATGDALREPPFPDYFPDGFFEFRQTYIVTVY